jgi:hypothetical protein
MLRDLIKQILREATSDSSGARGSYVLPLQPKFRKFNKSQLGPFTEEVSEFDNVEKYWDSLDGNMDKKDYVKKKKSNTLSETDIKRIVNSVLESNSSVSAGEYNGPIELGMKKWSKSELGPFYEFVDTEYNHKKVKSTTKNNIEREVGMWEKGKDGTYDIDTHPVHTINEDLSVWFGTKKKPKGSSQPKGPWVNICKKVDGKHPPCGRPEATDKAYPKCRAAGVAGKMSDSQKRAACNQKRRAEKSNPKPGTGNKPKMVSYKPKNESIIRKTLKLTESEIIRLIKKNIKEDNQPVTKYKQFNYMIGKTDDSPSNPSKYDILYFLKNNNTYEVYSTNLNSEIVNRTGLNLPLESEIGVVYDSNEKKFKNNDDTLIGNRIAKLINYGMGTGNWVIYTDKNGSPSVGRFTIGKGLPKDLIKDKNEKPLKNNQNFTTKDYFTVGGRGAIFGFEDVKKADISNT